MKRASEPSAWDKRNSFLRQQVAGLLSRTVMTQGEFGLYCGELAKSHGMRFYRSDKDVKRCVRNWLAGTNGVYAWALDVIEIAYAELRGKEIASKSTSSNMTGQTVTAEVTELKLVNPQTQRFTERGLAAEDAYEAPVPSPRTHELDPNGIHVHAPIGLTARDVRAAE
jgi:hypothetical protein